MLLPYGRLAIAAFLLYGIGFVVPLLRRDLGISDSTAGLHASAVAVGTLLAGAVGERYMRRLGPAAAPRIAMVAIGLAGVAVAFTPTVALTLAGAALFGIAGGILLSWVNQSLSSLGGERGRMAISRVNLVGLTAGLVAPVAISAVEGLGFNGRVAMLLPLPAVAVLEALHWRTSTSAQAEPARKEQATPPDHRRSRRLPAAYWRAWLVLVLVVALEFMIVYWGASLIDLRTGAGTAQATTAAASFLLGMLAVRAAMSAGFGAKAPRVPLSIGALVAVIAGALFAWQASVLPVAALGLFIAGMGVGPLYPVGITFALGLVRHAPETAAARATLATGVALIGAPYLLALAGEGIGLVNAWPLVAVAAVVAIGLVAATRRDTAPIEHASSDPDYAANVG